MDGYLVRLNERTTLEFREPAPGGTGSELLLSNGGGYFFAKSPTRLPRITTPQVSASVRGTEFVVEVTDDTTVISVLSGSVEASNAFGAVSVASGEQAIARAGRAPTKRILVNPLDAVQWALYYPAILGLSDYAEFPVGATAGHRAGWAALAAGEPEQARAHFGGESWRDVMGRSMLAYIAGDHSSAYELLELSTSQPASLLLYASALQLSAGQTREAERLLSRAEAAIASAAPESQAALRAGLLAQRALIALVQNRLEDAEELVRRAESANPDSASVSLLQSYLAQARFDLEGARSWLEQTVGRRPGSALAGARLAELQLGFGQTDRALSTLAGVLAGAPAHAYALTVAGFAELTRLDPQAAIAYFQRALEQDTSLPLPHLGLGLARIREGRLIEGRQEIELAVHLDPYVSLYRSYLGKAYFEEEREALAAREYTRAIELDPRDPTPHLYRALLELSDRRPIQALASVQASIERNDRRAVFRSRFLLDQDLGVRSTSLSQIFSKVGFDEVARLEASLALSRDYSNYSAHLLLSRSSRDNQAFLSQELIARLLVPPSFNSLVGGSGAGGEASFNEYTTLFDRPARRTRLGGAARSFDRMVTGRLDHTRSSGRLAYSGSYGVDYSAPVRDNPRNLAHDLFSKGIYAMGAKDTLIWEGGAVFSDVEREFDVRALFTRLGYHHRFGPGSHLLAVVTYDNGSFDSDPAERAGRLSRLRIVEGKTTIADDPFAGAVLTGYERDDWGLRADVQYIWNAPWASLVVGGGALRTSTDSIEDGRVSDLGTTVLGEPPTLRLSSRASSERSSVRTYLYGTWHASSWTDVFLGLSYESFALPEGAFIPAFVSGTRRETRFKPKLGLMLYPSPSTTLRAALFDAPGRTAPTDVALIEPTIVAGFNQRFDMPADTETRVYTAAVDHRFSARRFAGLVVERKESETLSPIVDAELVVDRTSGESREELNPRLVASSRQTDSLSAYFNQVVSDRFAAAARYSLVSREGAIPEDEVDQSQRFQLRLSYFHPGGFFAFGTATALLDAPEDEADASSIFERGGGRLDAGFGYEFSRRRGAVRVTFPSIGGRPLPDEPDTRKFQVNVGIVYTF